LAQVSVVTIQRDCCIATAIVMNLQQAGHMQEAENTVS
jgi:hypothetical protein